MLAVPNHDIFHDVRRGSARIDADPADSDLARLRSRAPVDLENVAVLEQYRLLHYAHRTRELRMAFQVAIVAVDRNEELRTDQVDHQPQLLLASMSARVDQAGLPVVIDHIRI